MVDLLRAFDEFWPQKPYTLHISNDSRSYGNFRRMLQKCENNTEQLDCLISESKCNRETLRRIAVSFYDYLGRQTGRRVSSELFGTKYYNYPFERQLDIAKFLQEPHTNTELLQKFIIDERTLRSDLQALDEGIEIMGTTLRIEVTRKGRRKYYKSTVHPVFLPLNLTEAYTLTRYLPAIVSGNDQNADISRSYDPNAEIIKSIAGVIKAQLSNYAWRILFPGEYNTGDTTVGYRNDEELAMSREGITMYLLKSGKPCDFVYEGTRYRGRVVMEGRRPALKLDSGGELNADLGKVEFLIDSVDYQ